MDGMTIRTYARMRMGGRQEWEKKGRTQRNGKSRVSRMLCARECVHCVCCTSTRLIELHADAMCLMLYLTVSKTECAGGFEWDTGLRPYRYDSMHGILSHTYTHSQPHSPYTDDDDDADDADDAVDCCCVCVDVVVDAFCCVHVCMGGSEMSLYRRKKV